MNFKIGDLAVYPYHGVGVIEAIETRRISTSDESTFYVLRILDNGMVLLVPTDSAVQIGLREVVNSKEASRIFLILRDRKVNIRLDLSWNRRQKEYNEKLKTGSAFEIAEVLRDLEHLRRKKDLSFGEKRMLGTARSLLIRELSIATKSEEDTIEKKLNNIFH